MYLFDNRMKERNIYTYKVGWIISDASIHT
jgi:hypothetical protein